jgi:uncharacterized protein involved in exopolysaccharide biosynthesis
MNQQIPLQEYLGILLRQRRLILIVFAAGLACALGLAWAQSPVYSAAAKLRVSSERARIRVGPDGTANSAFDPVNEATLAAEVALLHSVALVREVLESFRERPSAPPAEPGFALRAVDHAMDWLTWPMRSVKGFYRRMHGIPDLSPFEHAVAETAARVQVGVIDKSNLIHVSYTAADPQWAADFVNTLVARHLERHMRLNQQSEALHFFEEQRERLGERQRVAHRALAELSEREKVDSLANQQAQLQTQRIEVEANLADADVQLVEATARGDFLRKVISASYSRDSKLPAAVASGGASLVKSRIIELELQRSQLLSQFTTDSIKMRDVDRQLAEARRLLEAEQENPSGAFAAVSTDGDSLELDLARTQAEVAALEARIEALQKQAATYRAAEDHLEQISAEYTRLEQEASRADAEYLNYVKAADEAKLAHVLDELGIVNVTIVEPAEVPVAPLSSSQWKVVILGVVLSLAAGLGLAFVRDYFDPSLKSAAQAERLTALPVLVEIAS